MSSEGGGQVRLLFRVGFLDELLEGVAAFYSGQGTTTKWGGGDVCHGVDLALPILD